MSSALFFVRCRLANLGVTASRQVGGFPPIFFILYIDQGYASMLDPCLIVYRQGLASTPARRYFTTKYIVCLGS